MRNNTAPLGTVAQQPHTLPAGVWGTVLSADIPAGQSVKRGCCTLNTLLLKSNKGNDNKEEHGGIERNIYKTPHRGCGCKGVGRRATS